MKLAMAHQRPRHVQASVLDLAGVPTAIVQYTLALRDVVSFLEALPAAMRSPGLAAVLQLLSAPLGATHWPELCLNRLDDDTIDRIGAIINVVNAVRITGLCYSRRWPRDPNFNVPFCGFVAKWAPKVTTVDLTASCLSKHRDEYCRALARCTPLKRVCVTIDEPGLLEAVMSPAHCVSELELAALQFWHVPAASTMTTVQRWLASGHARSLALRNFVAPNNSGLVRALASSPTLSSLCIDHSLVFLIRLVTYIAEQTVFERYTPTGLLFRPALKTLVLRSMRNVDLGQYRCILAMVSQSLVLEHLRVEHMDLHGVVANRPSLSSSPTLRTVTFNCVVLSEMSLKTTLAWITRSRHLESVTWHDVRYFGAHASAPAKALRCCIDAGAHRVRFTSCGIGTNGAAVLAAILHETRIAFELDLSGNPIRLRGVQALLEALAMCTNVAVKLPLECKGFVEDNNCLHVAKARAADVTTHVIGDVVVLQSVMSATTTRAES
ncbi:hypothetical protein SPRG_11122 [Saprolegnia parasitica CBS 223.65]|uniref:F-box domain-containing protein n=1 Tax=Saprolegnia parasitica (strain CBS 223.65) TaxID=695850 RepID=A0A067BYW1_SAPPC|nr:hypothetical protein SPRG_11122 [Saprolegnia parasitica CBS 223.65]KDO23674.1 hypothetical protein SPRG_11122 [Saprolegnia parasitica CBS 223.65]|eukprot:XP_012205657.1 hypothetical protein SPRG_11122 [Saprolegnia parasitica CBS 223.65]